MDSARRQIPSSEGTCHLVPCTLFLLFRRRQLTIFARTDRTTPKPPAMDLQHALSVLNSTIDEASTQFRRVPGSSILLRYIKNSYQNDPIRSVVELCLFLFAVRYLLAPRYSTKQKSMDLTEEVRLDPSCRSTFHEGRLIPRVGDRRAS
jgi:hypothetical protein